MSDEVEQDGNTRDEDRMSESGELNTSAYKWCWGTVDLSDRLVWNPLVAEMVTASSMMLELWKHVVDPSLRGSLAAGFAAEDERSTSQVAAFLAGVSRLGHASPSGMDSFGRGQRPLSLLDRVRGEWQAQALRAGLPLSGAVPRSRQADPEHITAAVLPRLTGCDCADYVDGEQCHDRDHRGLYVAAYALNRHRGDVLHADTVAKAYRATGGPGWDAIRSALVNAVARHVGIDPESLPRLVRPTDPRRLTALGRLVAQSNLLSGGGTFREFASPHDTLEEMSAQAEKRAREAVARMGGAR
ncbi:hypothetical protein [Streptomyces sp. NPDC006638]|uniref:hypothetical protein n=1 Tax=Streptomyces sp. NPDC006638 TaxID=3157183 RepID=UPI0033B0F3FC